MASPHTTYNGDAKRAKGMCRQRIQKAWGHTAHRGWARFLLDRARDLITHGPAQRAANGAAMPTDEDDQDITDRALTAQNRHLRTWRTWNGSRHLGT